jgi:hypothetical protein
MSTAKKAIDRTVRFTCIAGNIVFSACREKIGMGQHTNDRPIPVVPASFRPSQNDKT